MGFVKKRNGNKMKNQMMKWKWTQMRNTLKELGRKINLMNFSWSAALRTNTNKARKFTFVMEDFRIGFC